MEKKLELLLQIVPEERVILSDLSMFKSTIGEFKREIAGVIYPKTCQEIQSIVKWANDSNVTLYPISTGKNWGMGSKLPVVSGCFIVELSKMNRILDYNETFGTVIIEAGVTQKQLYEFLSSKKSKFMSGVTGSGESTSVIGNALDKGGEYFNCRFENIFGVEAVLGNGSVIKTGFRHYENSKNVHSFKYGVGPYLDGLFAQSNFGIVTSLGLMLRHKPKRSVAFKCTLYKESEFAKMIDIFASLRRQEIITTAAHISNLGRTKTVIGSAVYHYLSEVKGMDSNTSYLESKRISDTYLSDSWSIGGGILGTDGQVKDTCRAIKKSMKGIAKVSFMTEKKLNFAQKILGLLSFIPKVKDQLAIVSGVTPLFEIMTKSKPTDLALSTVFYPMGPPPHSKDLDVERSNCGLLFSLPMVPNEGASAAIAVKITEEVFAKYSFKPYITLNMLTPTGLEGVINNVFDRFDPEAVSRAKQCIQDLNRRFMDEGFIPYRADIDSMDLIVKEHDEFWNAVAAIKDVLDPNYIISPKRYNRV